jgi:hypothetical protein
MPTSSPNKSRRTFPPRKYVILSAAKDLLLFCSCTLLLSLFTAQCPAQTLALPGWAGSGIGSEPWWHNAIFYRIDPQHFQDSNADGTGDLPGIALRFDYLQSLAVDAIIIPVAPDDPGFDDLLHEASNRHFRIIISIDHAANSAEILGLARLWLTRGAAGISIEGPLLNTAPLPELRKLTNSFPGERILIARPSNPTPTGPAELTAQFIDFPKALAPDKFPTNLQQPPPPLAKGTIPLLESDSGTRVADALADDKARSIGLQKLIAVKMLTTRGAISLLYGQELGMPGTPATMPWTPTNITAPKPEPIVEEPPQPAQPAAPPPREDVYGAFKPYVLPKPKPKPPPTVDGVPIVDPNTLPGFSTIKTPATTSPVANVAIEDADPNSMLSFYRRLIQLHQNNAALRSGTIDIINHDAEKALVSIRRPPGNARTASPLIIVCNLGDQPLTISLDPELKKLHLIVGSLRPLAASWTGLPPSQPSGAIQLPPFSAYIGELYH